MAKRSGGLELNHRYYAHGPRARMAMRLGVAIEDEKKEGLRTDPVVEVPGWFDWLCSNEAPLKWFDPSVKVPTLEDKIRARLAADPLAAEALEAEFRLSGTVTL